MVDRDSRQRLKVSHQHHYHRLNLASGSAPVLLVTVVQGHSHPCQWAHAYGLVPSCPPLISEHLRFDSGELESYRQFHVDQSLRWLNSAFMLQLALDRILRRVRLLLPAHDQPLSPPQPIDNGELLRLHINGDLPQLDALLAACGEHYLLHRQLQDLQAFPRLRSDLAGESGQALAPGLLPSEEANGAAGLR